MTKITNFSQTGINCQTHSKLGRRANFNSVSNQRSQSIFGSRNRKGRISHSTTKGLQEQSQKTSFFSRIKNMFAAKKASKPQQIQQTQKQTQTQNLFNNSNISQYQQQLQSGLQTQNGAKSALNTHSYNSDIPAQKAPDTPKYKVANNIQKQNSGALELLKNLKPDPENSSMQLDDNGNVAYFKSGGKAYRIMRDDQGNITGFMESILDKNGKETLDIFRDAQGNVESYRENIYDDSGNLVRDISREPDGTAYSYSEFEYDNKGNNTRIIERDSYGNLTGYNDLKYDASGNWISNTAKNPDGLIDKRFGFNPQY